MKVTHRILSEFEVPTEFSHEFKCYGEFRDLEVMLSWCHHNLHGRWRTWCRVIPGEEVNVNIALNSDALLFKLTWITPRSYS
jgi:hypothetical protein